MTRRTLLIAACALAVAPLATAQDRDPVTGTWGSDGLPYLELKFDGKSTVTGVTIWRHGTTFLYRAPIKSGTFDSKTGALRLAGDGQKPDGSPAQYVLEGKISGATLSGTYKIATDSGQFTFTRQPPASASSSQPATTGGDIAGTWVGYMADDTRKVSITMDLKFEGKTISGTITGPPSPGDITKGSFDPATGAFQVHVVVQDENRTEALFEGTLAGKTVTGRLSLAGRQAGTFSITRQN